MCCGFKVSTRYEQDAWIAPAMIVIIKMDQYSSTIHLSMHVHGMVGVRFNGLFIQTHPFGKNKKQKTTRTLCCDGDICQLEGDPHPFKRV
jgi:hypothetical protein